MDVGLQLTVQEVQLKIRYIKTPLQAVSPQWVCQGGVETKQKQ